MRDGDEIRIRVQLEPGLDAVVTTGRVLASTDVSLGYDTIDYRDGLDDESEIDDGQRSRAEEAYWQRHVENHVASWAEDMENQITAAMRGGR